jgi:tripartite-type tricarboxylate transporter receptor subunit TctC
MPMSRRSLLLAAGLASVAAFAHAQDYPNRAIKIIVPYPAGGALDLTARLLGEKLGRDLGQTVVIENRSGANGTVGLQAVFQSAPDGYTLALTGASNIAAGPHLQQMSFDPTKIRHITRLVRTPLTVAVRKDLPAQDLKEFIELGKKQELRYSSAGVGSSHHLTAEMFRQKTGVQLQHVPYRGTNPAVTDLIAGVVDASFGDPTLIQLAKGGQVRAIAVTSEKRWSLVPDVPTVSETVPGFVAENWYGLAAPPETPDAILDFLHDKIVKAMQDPDTVKKFTEAGLEPATMPRKEFSDYVRTDSAAWGEVVKRGNIKLAN